MILFRDLGIFSTSFFVVWVKESALFDSLDRLYLLAFPLTSNNS